MSLLHPDVAVVLSHARLRVQEWHSDAAVGTQAGVVAATVLDGFLIELISETEEETYKGMNLKSNRKRGLNRSRTAQNSLGQNKLLLMKGKVDILCHRWYHSSGSSSRGLFFLPCDIVFRALTCVCHARSLAHFRLCTHVPLVSLITSPFYTGFLTCVVCWVLVSVCCFLPAVLCFMLFKFLYFVLYPNSFC